MRSCLKLRLIDPLKKKIPDFDNLTEFMNEAGTSYLGGTRSYLWSVPKSRTALYIPAPAWEPQEMVPDGAHCHCYQQDQA